MKISEGDTIVHYAIKNGAEDCAKVLLNELN